MPKVSVVTPCYNAEEYIGKMIESLQNQSFVDWEQIIVDDGSTDNSAEVINQYVAKDSRIKLIRQSNSGTCKTRNNGFKECNPESEYLLFFDADDCLEPQMLETMVNYLDQHQHLGVVYCDYYSIDAEGKPIETYASYPRIIPSRWGIDFMPNNVPKTPLVAVVAGLGGGLDSRCLFRRSIYEKTSGWDEQIGRNGGQIMDLVAQFILISEVHFLPQKLYQYRLHDSGQLHINVNYEVQAQKILNKWKQMEGVNVKQKEEINTAIWFYEKRLIPLIKLGNGKQLLSQGKIITALKLYLKSGTDYLQSVVNYKIQPNLQ